MLKNSIQNLLFQQKQCNECTWKRIQILNSKGLGIFTPGPQMEKIPKKFPHFIKALNKLDEIISRVPPFNRIGDHIIVTAEYSGNKPPHSI
jgi:hypothetical protein